MNLNSRWIDQLPAEDIEFFRQFILASGSLKDLAKQYGISYPTVRLRLNRLMDLVRECSEDSPTSPIERELRLLSVRGEISRSAADQILRAHKKTIDESEE